MDRSFSLLDVLGAGGSFSKNANGASFLEAHIMEMLSTLDDPQYGEINGPGKAVNSRLKRDMFLATASVGLWLYSACF